MEGLLDQIINYLYDHQISKNELKRFVDKKIQFRSDIHLFLDDYINTLKKGNNHFNQTLNEVLNDILLEYKRKDKPTENLKYIKAVELAKILNMTPGNITILKNKGFFPNHIQNKPGGKLLIATSDIEKFIHYHPKYKTLWENK